MTSSGSGSELLRFASAVPLAATAAVLGPSARHTGSAASRLAAIRSSPAGMVTAVQSAGHTGSRLLALLAWWGGSASAEVLAVETAAADPGEVTAALERLVDAGLVRSVGSGGWALTPGATAVLGSVAVSLGDQNAITSDALALICRTLGIKAPNLKQERLEAVAGCFADPDRRARLVAELPRASVELLEAIGDRASWGPVPAEELGVPAHLLRLAEPARFGFRGPPDHQDIRPLWELTSRGIAGVDPWDNRIWVWREAWPLLDRPLYRRWPSVPAPSLEPVGETGRRVPPIMADFERALSHWDSQPPPVLKNGDRRLSKAVVKATARALGVRPAGVEVVSGVALSMGLLLPNVVSVSGRGRNRKVEQVWMADPDLREAWSARPAMARWARVVAEWADGAATTSDQLVANRHLLAWELAALPPGLGWADEANAMAWLEHRHGPIGMAEAFAQALSELRCLGVVTGQGPVALTELGRLVLEEPDRALEADVGSARHAVVQADHTIVCPPDLDADLLARVAAMATLESDAGARVFRLNEALVTAAVQGGTSAEEIVEFLESLSSVSVADTVKALVLDAAARAHRVTVMSAATVVVTTEPAELVAACKVKGAGLTAVADTVAVSQHPPEKVRLALQRRGLAPQLIGAGDDGFVARRSSDEVAALEHDARYHRRLAERTGNRAIAAEAERMAARVEAARDPSRRLEVDGPVAVTPVLARRVLV